LQHRASHCFHPEYAVVDPNFDAERGGRPRTGVKSALEYYKQIFAGLSGVNIQADDIQWDRGTGHRVQWSMEARHTGTLFGIPATQRKIRVQGLAHHIFDGYRIRRSEYNWNAVGFMQQVLAQGPLAMPPPGMPAAKASLVSGPLPYHPPSGPALPSHHQWGGQAHPSQAGPSTAPGHAPVHSQAEPHAWQSQPSQDHGAPRACDGVSIADMTQHGTLESMHLGRHQAAKGKMQGLQGPRARTAVGCEEAMPFAQQSKPQGMEEDLCNELFGDAMDMEGFGAMPEQEGALVGGPQEGAGQPLQGMGLLEGLWDAPKEPARHTLGALPFAFSAQATPPGLGAAPRPFDQPLVHPVVSAQGPSAPMGSMPMGSMPMASMPMDSAPAPARHSGPIPHMGQLGQVVLEYVEYVCGYCGARKVSTSRSVDGRVRIRCECGGKHGDSKPRMHAKWTLSQ